MVRCILEKYWGRTTGLNDHRLLKMAELVGSACESNEVKAKCSTLMVS